MGDGEKIRIFVDPWLPQLVTFRPITTTNGAIHLVSDLIMDYGIWNERLIMQLFVPINQEVISSIPLSIVSREDVPGWHYTSHRNYSVKSRYHLLLKERLVGWHLSSNVERHCERFYGILIFPSKFVFLCGESLPTCD